MSTPAFDLPDIIPVFPLPKALLLPRARLPLHVFEPRYIAMLDDVLKTECRLIGMIQPRPGGECRVHGIGCAGRVTQFSETEDGRYMITLSGTSRYRIRSEAPGFVPYRRFEVAWEGFEADRGTADHDPGLDRDNFLGLLMRFFDRHDLRTDWESLKSAEDELLINTLSMLLDFTVEDKQALLEAPCLTTRRETLVTLIEFHLRGGGNEAIQ